MIKEWAPDVKGGWKVKWCRWWGYQGNCRARRSLKVWHRDTRGYWQGKQQKKCTRNIWVMICSLNSKVGVEVHIMSEFDKFPSIHFHQFIEVRSPWQQAMEGISDVLFPSNMLQLLLWDPKALTGQTRYKSSPVSSWVFPSLAHPENLSKGAVLEASWSGAKNLIGIKQETAGRGHVVWALCLCWHSQSTYMIFSSLCVKMSVFHSFSWCLTWIQESDGTFECAECRVEFGKHQLVFLNHSCHLSLWETVYHPKDLPN